MAEPCDLTLTRCVCVWKLSCRHPGVSVSSVSRFPVSVLAACLSVCWCNQTRWRRHWGPFSGRLQASASLQRLVRGFSRGFQWPHSPTFLLRTHLNALNEFSIHVVLCWSADGAAVHQSTRFFFEDVGEWGSVFCPTSQLLLLLLTKTVKTA